MDITVQGKANWKKSPFLVCLKGTGSDVYRGWVVVDRSRELGGTLEMSVFPRDKCSKFSLVLSMTKGPGQVFTSVSLSFLLCHMGQW